MWSSRRVKVPDPGIELSSVHGSIFRAAAAEQAARGGGALAIGPAGSPAGSGPTALEGPEGFWLSQHVLDGGERRQIMAESERFLVLIGGEGTVTARPGPRGEPSVELARHSVALYAPGAAPELEGWGPEARVIAIRYQVPARRAADAGRARPGLRHRTGLAPLRERPPLRWLPRAAYRLLSPRDLYPMLGPIGRGPGRFELVGPPELVAVIAYTPRGTGPALHVHRRTTEMFVVLSGRFEVRWGDAGEEHALLDPYDAIVIPRGLSRSFTAVAEEPCWILPMVVGADHELEDIVWLGPVERQLMETLPPGFGGPAARAILRFGDREESGARTT